MGSPLRNRQGTGVRVGLSLLVVLASACGDTSEPEPDRTPTITITGVTEGDVAQGPVTIGINVDVGTYTAELNGQVFFLVNATLY